MKVFVETPRTLIRELLEVDAEAMFEMDSDPQVHRYLGNEPVQNIGKIKEVIAFVRKQYADNGIGRWAVVDKQSDKFIGWTGFKLITEITNGQVNYYDFGYRFNRNYWAHGLSTETGKAVLEYGCQLLRTELIYATTDPENLASRRVLEKLGFVYKGDFEVEAQATKYREQNTWYEFRCNHLE
ncbi:MAG: GNAT family N-acetyltransferase [Bacteroidia bacterium]|nr:GNAT family N-acetyltransferase [Bacteroidia bacterium]